jgi:serine/threonine-protein kinase
MLDSEGSPKLIDFGLAVVPSRSARVTRTGIFIGSYNYSAPEQLKGEKNLINESTDMYALGATAYELLTQHRVFLYPSFGHRLANISAKPERPLRALNPHISRRLNKAILRCVHPNQNKRLTMPKLLEVLSKEVR